MGLPAIGLAMTIGSGIMQVVSGFAQASTQEAAARLRQNAATQNLALQYNAIAATNQQQAEAVTAEKSTRMGQAQQNLATLQVVMGERGFNGGSFTGLANNIYNNESVDLARVDERFNNAMDASKSREDVAQQDYQNEWKGAASVASAANSSAWLNAFGTTFKVAGGIASQQIGLSSQQSSYDGLIAADQKRYDTFLSAVSKGGAISPYAQ